MAGRRSKLTPELQAQFCDALSKGATRTAACGLVGISYTTFRNWMNAGEQAKSGVQLAFLEAVTRAEGTLERTLATALYDIATGVDEEARTSDRVRALSFYLERRCGWHLRTEVSGPDAGPVEVRGLPIEVPDVAAGKARIRALAKQLQGR